VSLLSEANPEYGVMMKYTHGNACTANKDFSLRLQINCDEGASRTIFYLDENSVASDECEPLVIMNSPHGCPVFSMPAMWRWAD
jgi:hypothetical protein